MATHTVSSPDLNSEHGDDLSDYDLSIRFFVTDSEVGSIIGLKGENIKNLRNESGARINISDGSNYERIVTVRGSTSQVVKAVYLTTLKFETDHLSSNVYDGEEGVSLRLIVPNNNCGSLIGRNGSNIKELREKTGAKIQVANMLLPKSTEREVSLSGPNDKVLECVRKLAKIALETKPNVPHTPYNGISGDMTYRKGNRPMRPDARRTTGGGPGTPGGGGFEERKVFRMHDMNKNRGPGNYDMDFMSMKNQGMDSYDDEYMNMVGLITEEMVIPNQIVGFIIGKNGNKINEIRQNSGAQIKIVDCEVDTEARRFIISGARANVQSALHSIQTAKLRRNRNRALRATSEQED